MLDTVLFDLGGVLTPDPWQAILLTPGRGLADSLGLDRREVEDIGESLWPRYSLSPRPEAEYWADFAAALGREVPESAVDHAVGSLVVGHPRFRETVSALEAAGVRWGFISDNTAFWYPRQLSALGAADRVDPELEFLSFRYALAKTETRPSLFEVAAAELDAARTLVIDDRPKNIIEADRSGFGTERYSRDGDEDGSRLSDLVLRRVRA